MHSIPAGGGHLPSSHEGQDGADIFAITIAVSLVLHVAALGGMYAYSEYWAPKIKLSIKPDAYVVHLIDPGPVADKAAMGKSSVVDAVPAPQAMAVKKVEPIEKKLLPVTKDTGGEIKKMAVVNKIVPKKTTVAAEKTVAAPHKVKQAVEEDKQSQSVAKEVRERKGGGTVDIQKFPYEWYLRVMESKIFQNWDALKLNYFADRPLKAIVFFQIDRKGNIAKLNVEQSTLNDQIDNSAMEAVRKSAPFPPLPQGYKDDTLEVHFGFTIEPGH